MEKNLTKEEFRTTCDKIATEIRMMCEARGSLYVVDGVINPDKYYDADLKIMWLLKEANSTESWCYQDKFTDPEQLKSDNALAVFRRVIYTSYGILNGLDKEWKEYPKSHEAEAQGVLSEIAFVNIKKEPGGNSSSDHIIKQAYNANKELLKAQFVLYDPDVVIFGNTLDYIDKTDFPGLEQAGKEVSEFHNHYYDAGDKLYINAWHPAVRGKGFTDEGYVMDIVTKVHEWKDKKTN